MSRRTAAAVPASKARIGTTYAIRHNGKLVRFKVTKITIHKVSDTGSPHDYENEITGTVFYEPGKTETLTIEASKLLGQFEQYEELIAKKEAEKAEAKAKENAAKALQDKFVKAIAKAAGVPVPQKGHYRDYEHSDAIDTTYSGVVIKPAIFQVLIDKLEAKELAKVE
jgi:hypothetical protein